MAVIKIVPMPGAVGDKGDEGAVGPQGQQGATGPTGAQGIQGFTGNIGPAGAQGAPGTTPTSGTWDAKFAFHSGIDVSGTDVRYEANKMGYYYCVGDLVHWEFRMSIYNPASWGTRPSWGFELPFPPYFNNYTDSIYGLRNSLNRTIASGYFRVFADTDPTPLPGPYSPENHLDENEYHFLFANVIIRTLIRTSTGGIAYSLPGHPYNQSWPADADLVGYAFMNALNQEPETGILGDGGYPGNPRTVGYRGINSTWPANLVQALIDQNDGIPANNAIDGGMGSNSNQIQFNFSGVYRKA